MGVGGRIRSMTGHGAGESPLGSGRVLVEMRSVNHRYFEVRTRLPPELAEHSMHVEEQARRVLSRGRVEVSVRLEGDAFGRPVLDVGRARAAYEQLLALRNALAPNEPLPLGLLSSVPELFAARDLPDAAPAREALSRAVEQACDGVCAMRVREGDALASELSSRVTRLEQHLATVEARAPQVVAALRKRLAERVEKLLGGMAVAVDTHRLEHEVVILADRADITEECTRLRSHCDQFRTLLLEGAEQSTGRRLDFLLQEMAREANTIGAKSADADTAQLVVEMKADVERMREQVQNVL